ncbi:uncharacterized protein LOC128273827 [Anopheles cruzii]|uniref:uncharacterized protein LOC128273827 n=1 Tax=Anopheles cruzii TaxID=68878 RepID=UPI0022EC62A8|nr:uncharacterized protein LOC128273827 [Anopheles cruzii]
MNDQSQLIPGIVRRAATASSQSATLYHASQQNKAIHPPNAIIPGVVRVCHSVPKKHLPENSSKRPSGSHLKDAKCDELTRQAVAEILRETTQGKTRAEQQGSTALRKCPLRKTNIRFLNRTVISMVNHNNREKKKTTHRSKLKLNDLKRHRKNGERRVEEPSEPILIQDND